MTSLASIVCRSPESEKALQRRARPIATRLGRILKSAVVPAFSTADLRRALTSDGGLSVSVV